MARLEELASAFAEDAQFNFVSSRPQVEPQIEEIVVPKVLVLYPYNGKEISINKNEILALLDPANKGI